MWHDSSKLRLIFIFGATLAVVGLGMISKDHDLLGAIILCAGIAVLVISFAVIRLKLAVSFNR